MSVEAWLWLSCGVLAMTAGVCAYGWSDARRAMEFYREQAVQARGRLEAFEQMQAAIERARVAARFSAAQRGH